MISMDNVTSLEKHTVGTIAHFVAFCALESDNISTEWASRQGLGSQTLVVGRQEFEEVWNSITKQAFAKYKQRFSRELNDGNLDAARQAQEHVERTTTEATRTDDGFDQLVLGWPDFGWNFGSSSSSAAYQQSEAVETTLHSGAREFWKWDIDQEGGEHMEFDVGGQDTELD
jgi:hypothetical protein